MREGSIGRSASLCARKFREARTLVRSIQQPKQVQGDFPAKPNGEVIADQKGVFFAPNLVIVFCFSLRFQGPTDLVDKKVSFVVGAHLVFTAHLVDKERLTEATHFGVQFQ